MADAAPPVQTLFGIRAHRHDCETLLPESDVNAVTTLKSKRKERDSPEATELAFSRPPENMGANPPVNREKYFDIAFFKIKLINRPAFLSRPHEWQ